MSHERGRGGAALEIYCLLGAPCTCCVPRSPMITMRCCDGSFQRKATASAGSNKGAGIRRYAAARLDPEPERWQIVGDRLHARLDDGSSVAMEAASKALASADGPTVADKFISSTFEWCKAFDYTAKEDEVAPILMAYRKAMRFAHRFVLDKEFRRTPRSCRPSRRETAVSTGLRHVALRDDVDRVRPARQAADDAADTRSCPPAWGRAFGVLLERVNDTVATVAVQRTAERSSRPISPSTRPTSEHCASTRLPSVAPFDAAYRSDRIEKCHVMSDPESAGLLQRVSHGALWALATARVCSAPRTIDGIQYFGVPDAPWRAGVQPVLRASQTAPGSPRWVM